MGAVAYVKREVTAAVEEAGTTLIAKLDFPEAKSPAHLFSINA